MLLLAAQAYSYAQDSTSASDSLSIKNDVYSAEDGFFHKAYRDASDPTFMFTDSKGEFSFGIGGTLVASTYYDFNGSIDSYLFSPSAITVPTDTSPHLNFTCTGSNIYLKARTNKSKVKISAYLELVDAESDFTDFILLQQAYVSVGRFSLGKTYSFFTDLEAGVRTVDLRGPNTQVYYIHPLVGYSQNVGNHFSFGIALEQPSEISSSYQSKALVAADYNRLPDVAARIKYRGDIGHIQVSGLYRELSYWASNTGFKIGEGKTFYKNGFGISVSGSIKPFEKLTISGQAVSGKGIGTYIQDLCYQDVNLVQEDCFTDDGYSVLSPTPMYGGYIGASYSFADRFEASAVYGVCHLSKNDDQYAATDFKSSSYASFNLFYFISRSCLAGLAYTAGTKRIYTASSTEESLGRANRFNAYFVYRF